MASQFLSPSSSPFGDVISKEIRHKVTAQYTNQAREELMTSKPGTSAASNFSMSEEKNKEFENPTSTLRQRKAELLGTSNNSAPVRDFDTVISNEQQSQEQITNDLLTLTR